MFANYSLVEEEQRVSRIAAVLSTERLLFVVGNKVCTPPEFTFHIYFVQYEGVSDVIKVWKVLFFQNIFDVLL